MSDDHDILTRIDVNLAEFMERFKDHEKKDDDRFRFLERMAWGFCGIYALGILASRFIR